MRNLIFAGWLCLAASLLAMVIGHAGTEQLSWVSAQISTYAAVAPHAVFVTSAIIMSALALLILGLLVSKHQILGTSYLASLVTALSGAGAAGLLMLAHFKETASSLATLKHAGFWAIRQQSFHDAGLLIFYYSALVLVMLAGMLAVTHHSGVRNKILGVTIFGMGPMSFLLMTTNWPKSLGFTGVTTGVNERVALFCLWLAAAMVFALAFRRKTCSV